MKFERALIAVIGCKASCKMSGSCINMLMLPMYDAFCGRMKWRSVLVSGQLNDWDGLPSIFLEGLRNTARRIKLHTAARWGESHARTLNYPASQCRDYQYNFLLW